MQETERPGPEEEKARPEWGTEEWLDYWGEGLGEIVEDGVPQELEDLGEGKFVSIESVMRTLDPPDERRISELSQEEKELLLRLASEWRDSPIGVSVIARQQEQEVVVPEGEEIDPEDLVDIRFEKMTEDEIRRRQEQEEREDYGPFPKEAIFTCECDRCGTQFNIPATIDRGESKGGIEIFQIRLEDGRTLESYGPDEIREGVWQWGYPEGLPCECISEYTGTSVIHEDILWTEDLRKRK